jgi:hypothetical protein
MKIDILAIPFNGDGNPPGVENPASALREAGLSSMQKSIGGSLQGNQGRTLDYKLTQRLNNDVLPGFRVHLGRMHLEVFTLYSSGH